MEAAVLPDVVPLRVTVGICTYRRESLFDTIASIARQELPAGCTLDLVIADNDVEARLAARLAGAATVAGLAIRYVHAPARNISVARNACLDAARGDLLAFIDDDETARPGWLAALLAAQAQTGAGAVFGPARAIYPPDAPRWMTEIDLHSNIPHSRGGIVETGYSSNVLLDLRQPALRQTRFDPLLGRTGGEDVDYFFRLHRQGVIMAITMAAEVSEPVAPKRLSFGWLLSRRFATGQIYGHCVLRSARQAGRAAHLAVAGTSLAKGLYCSARAAVQVFDRSRFCYWFLRGGFHFGVASGALAPPSTINYGGET